MATKPTINRNDINPQRDILANAMLAGAKNAGEIMNKASMDIVSKYIAAYEPRIENMQIPNVSLKDNPRAEIGRIAPLPGGKTGRDGPNLA